jgi:AcrR family transcriptional regulator
MEAKSEKTEAILATARIIFWKHGFRRVTIGEICREAKVSKMTFYKSFPNKIELAKAVLDEFYETSMANFRKLIRDESTLSEKMQKMIRMKLEGSNDISTEFIRDFLFSTDPELKSYFEEKSKMIGEEGIMLNSCSTSVRR